MAINQQMARNIFIFLRPTTNDALLWFVRGGSPKNTISLEDLSQKASIEVKNLEESVPDPEVFYILHAARQMSITVQIWSEISPT